MLKTFSLHWFTFTESGHLDSSNSQHFATLQDAFFSMQRAAERAVQMLSKDGECKQTFVTTGLQKYGTFQKEPTADTVFVYFNGYVIIAYSITENLYSTNNPLKSKTYGQKAKR